jgi:hypothetical protein
VPLRAGPGIRETVRVTAPEQLSPPVYACAAGAVLHAHAGDTLEPAVLLHTFLPAGGGDLDAPESRVDVHSDGAGSSTVTVRVLAGGQSLSWQLPIAPFVAALPGQPGDDGRMVLLAVVDAEPERDFWAVPVDCERLSAELQLPVADLVDALHGRLTPWLADDLELLLHDDAHDRAVDRSPAQTLASAVVAHYRGDLAAEQRSTELVRALELAPDEFTVELGARLCGALVTALAAAGPAAIEAVVERTGPFESEVLRILTELPALLDAASPEQLTDTAMQFLVAASDRDETVRAAVSVVARLAREAFGPELPDDELLRRLGMVDDAALVRIARLWVELAAAAARPPAGDVAVVPALAARVDVEGVPGSAWLRATAATLAEAALQVTGRRNDRIAEPLQAVRRLLAGEDPDVAAGLLACLELARFTRARAGFGPGGWLEVPPSAAAQATTAALLDGLDRDVAVDLLAETLEPDVDGVDLLDGLVCATAELLVHVEPREDPALRSAQVHEALAAVPAGPRGGRWLMATLLREAHSHDTSALDLAPFLPAEAGAEPERAAGKAGRHGVLLLGLSCLEALAATFGDAADMPREELLGLVLPTALAEHDLLRRPA